MSEATTEPTEETPMLEVHPPHHTPNTWRDFFIILTTLLITFNATGCRQPSPAQSKQPPIVGAWLVTIPEAPFPNHLFIFHADHTVQQSNPDAGDPKASDSNLMGAWAGDGSTVRGKVIEVTADRTSHHFLSRGEISFSLTVEADALRGTMTANFFDSNGKPLDGPIHATAQGHRILP